MSDLDEFFARCDDVLDNWHGGTDAMHGRPLDGDPKLPARADSYYEQREYATPSRMVALAAAVVLVPPFIVAGVIVGTVRAMRRDVRLDRETR